jgi:hypothetical protein
VTELRFPALLLVVGLASSACAGESPPPERIGDAQEQLRVYAAAAREYQRTSGEWPRNAGELLSVMTGPPTAETIPVELRGLEAEPDGNLTIAFRSVPAEPGRPLRGEIHVAPPHATDVPAAVMEWKYGGIVPAAWGSVALQHCALGEYALPADATRSRSEAEALPPSSTG